MEEIKANVWKRHNLCQVISYRRCILLGYTWERVVVVANYKSLFRDYLNNSKFNCKRFAKDDAKNKIEIVMEKPISQWKMSLNCPVAKHPTLYSFCTDNAKKKIIWLSESYWDTSKWIRHSVQMLNWINYHGDVKYDAIIITKTNSDLFIRLKFMWMTQKVVLHVIFWP